MQGEQRSHHGAASDKSRGRQQHPEQQQHVDNMQRQVNGVVTGRIKLKELVIERMREPGDRMPVGGVTVENAHLTVSREAALDMGIRGDVHTIVKVAEGVTGNGEVRCGGCQYKKDPEDQWPQKKSTLARRRGRARRSSTEWRWLAQFVNHVVTPEETLATLKARGLNDSRHHSLISRAGTGNYGAAERCASRSNPLCYISRQRPTPMLRNQRSVFPSYTVSAVRKRILVALATAIAVVLFLNCPAAAQAAVEYGHIVTGSGAGLAGLSNKINSTLAPDKKSASVQTIDTQPGAATATESDLQDANRRALEQRVGKNAAKISLKSAPAKAVVRIDGKPVGQTPLLISLAPRRLHKIEMEGPRMELGKQQLKVAPNERRKIELPLSAPPPLPKPH